MALGKGFFKNLFKRNIEDEDDFFIEYNIDGEEEEVAQNWNWDSLIKDRHLLKLSDELQREKYIRSLVEQVSDASRELDRLSEEYNYVTSVLKDTDELELLAPEEKEGLEALADKMMKLEGANTKAKKAKKLMSEGQFQTVQRFADSMPKAYEEIKSAETQRRLIKEDLKRLEDEKQGFIILNKDLKNDMVNARGMIIISVFAAFVCVLMLLILQFGFKMDTKVGYLMVSVGIVVAVTAIYMKYLETERDQVRAYRSINRIILLQNTVKIRYVNNKNLLDYLYTKYNTSSADELKRIMDTYEEECERRVQNELNQKQLTAVEQEYKNRLARYRLNDVDIWMHNPLAVVEKKERVEVRHQYIIYRQKLRAQMDYNRKLAKEGEKELRQLIEEYPRYSKEVVDMLNRYE